MYQQLFERFAFGDVGQLLEMARDEKFSAQFVSQLQEIMSDPQRLVDLKLELAVTIEVGKYFVKAVYKATVLLCFPVTRS